MRTSKKAKPAANALSTGITAEIVAAHGLTPDEYARVVESIGRAPNLVELGIFSVMWSEHCSYKTTRKWLRLFPVTGPQVICGPGENAGVVAIGDGQAVIFKMESHNHPSFIEPFQGAATGVGGILRDVFTMGARPVALMNALRFGAPDNSKTRAIVNGVVAGISHYGNCVGVPTVGGETIFHAGYNGNPLVNAMAVGLADADKIFYSKASGVGNSVIYFGAKTGRDGIHGATMASAEFDETTEEKRPTVQVGDPFTEKLLIEACLELMATDMIVSIQDMGAAGLTCSSLEMASKGNLGITLAIESIPMREEGMTPYEVMLSESQERMLMVVKPGSEEKAFAIMKKWGLACATIGTLTDTGRMVLTHHGEIVCDIPVAPLSDAAPLYDRPYTLTPKRAVLAAGSVTTTDIGRALAALVACPDIASKRWIWEQYDHMVMNDTVGRPGGDAAVVRVHGTQKALAMTTDCTPRYVFADPYEGGKQAVAESWRNLTAVGATPLAITDCLNFGNPQKPEIMGQIVGAIQGMAEACRVLSYPVVSGNVSLYNETHGVGVQPTPAVGGVGLLVDARRRVGSAFTEIGHSILLIGETRGHLGSSLYLREIIGSEEGAPPPVDLALELKNGNLVRSLIEDGRLVSACHDVSDGGLLVALAEMCLPRDIGAQVRFASDLPPHAYAFGEDQARYLIAVPPAAKDEVMVRLNQADILFTDLGVTVPDLLIVEDVLRVPVIHLRELNETWLPGFMAG
ncbi:MAG: phosphoribosylformylglycinamidine synthase subunit PurL [Alphaproteobacteria bacterium]|nr:phosphoribosylformylglycinamidine synthase subunit PurL [Alphaproteobacteria bacterium]